MSAFTVRVGVLVGAATIVAGAIAFAQDRQRTAPAGSGATDVFNSVEGRLVVIRSSPEGAQVQKEEVVCEFDPTELQDRLAVEATLIRAREAELHAATLATKAAALAVTEYEQGIFLEDVQETEGWIKIAESKLASAEDKLDWKRRMYEKGYVSLFEKNSDELALKGSRFALEQAQSKKLVLMRHTRDKTMATLQANREAAKAHELLKQAELERERLTPKSLTTQIGRCKVTAPVAGRVHYITPIGTGAVVHDGQLLFQVIGDGATGITK
jgi:HlyD family secretion protein